MNFINLNDHYIDKKNYVKCFLIIYSALFVLMAFIIFSPQLMTNKAFMWQADGYNVYFKHLLWYSRNLKNLVFDQKFTFNMFDFYANEGLDTTLVYGGYIMGDPLYIFSFAVPEKYMHYYYSFVQVFKIYLSGICFSLFCININKITNFYALLLSSLNYSFCYFNMTNVSKHPHFLSALIYMPLILIGINKAINENKKTFLIISVAISALHSFYVFYTISLLVSIYTVCIVFLKKEEFSSKLKKIKNVIISAIIGVLIALPKILPMIDIYLSENRVGSKYNLDLFYELGYYAKIPSMLITYGSRNWLCLGYSFLVIIALIALFIDRKNKVLKVLVIISMIFIIFPIFGKALNGFTYVTNRWSWVLALIYMYILFRMWDRIFFMQTKGIIILGITIVFYVVFHHLIDRYYNLPLELQVGFFAFSLLLLIINRLYPLKYSIMCMFVIGIISIVLNGYFANADGYGGIASVCISNDKIEKLAYTNEMEEINKYYELDHSVNPVRYSGTGLNNGLDFLYKMSSTSHDNSLSNPYLVSFRKKVNVPTYATHFEDYDARAGFLTLDNVKYYVKKNNNNVPYGYKLINENKINNYYVYENENYLPLVYSYDKYIDLGYFDSLNSVEKEELMMNYCVCDRINIDERFIEDNNDANKTLTSKPLNYNFIQSPNIIVNKNSFIVTKDNSELTIKFDKELNDNSCFLYFDGVKYKSFSNYDLYFDKILKFGEEKINIDKNDEFSKDKFNKLSNGKKKNINSEKYFFGHGKETSNVDISINGEKIGTIGIITSYYQNYLGIEDFCVNLGSGINSEEVIELKFKYKGIYKFDNIDLIDYSYKNLSELVEKRKIDNMNDIVLSNDELKTSFNIDDDKIICISIPYSKHFKLYVNGNKHNIFPLNIYHIGFVANKGLNNIRLVYNNIYVIIGYVLSFLTFLGYLILINKKRK